MAQNAMKALEGDDDGQKTKKKEVGAALLTKIKPVKEGNETADEQPPQLNLAPASGGQIETGAFAQETRALAAPLNRGS